MTTIRGLAREDGKKLPSCATGNFVARARKAVDGSLLPLLEPLVVMLEALEPQLATVEQELGKLCGQEPVIAQLTTAPGIGAVIAASFVSVIDDAKRFKNAHQVESYIGLVPSLPALVQAERHAMLDVIEHLVEMERRRLYLRHAASSLYRYCIDRLGYVEDAALKRHRVAKLAVRLPQVLDELRAGTIHLTGAFLLSKYLTEDNAAALLGEARGRSRRQIEQLIARRFPRPDVPPCLEPVSLEVSGSTGAPQLVLRVAPPSVPFTSPVTCSEAGDTAHASPVTRSRAGDPARGRLEPLSPSRLRVEFTARAELCERSKKRASS